MQADAVPGHNLDINTVPGKVPQQINKQLVSKHLEKNLVTSKTQHGFHKKMSCQIYLSF